MLSAVQQKQTQIPKQKYAKKNERNKSMLWGDQAGTAAK